MVLTTIIRHAAAKRVPMIKFRKGGPNISPSKAACSASHSQSTGTPVTLGVTIEDWQLPSRYQRKQISQEEIDYINRGGPA